ncbi:uncharacterized protein LOC119107028 [Pollicipes pollicipes]|uniref:uncharacterized protein LOC119093073 n=1 Tax=Pollicipes pollicipes TaxID=41117 RepID=UPI0018857821|nr:uncharacterized protein LOC119093073 [Pollicipes pollicipes]XP_037072499.1 uncharacterized protein LOC119093625 [Pollicipes pollicipes]XP_037086276.1 uncharacterized protein LOC119107028 [Pollicipes pollicipes]
MSPLPEQQVSALEGGSMLSAIPALMLVTSKLLNAPSRDKRDLSAQSRQGQAEQGRQLLEVLTMFQNMDQFIGRDPDDMYDMLWTVDKDTGCALKLTCTLAALPKHLARPEDMLLLRMFGKRPFTVRNEELEKPAGIYKYAAFMGAKSLNQATCDTLFKACPMAGDQMVTVWRSVVELVPSMLSSMKPGK